MKAGRKAQNKFQRRLKHHEAAMVEARRKSGAKFDPRAWRLPGSRNSHKT